MNKSLKIWALVCLAVFAVYFASPAFNTKTQASVKSEVDLPMSDPNPNEFCPDAQEAKLPLPSSLPPNKLVEYQRILLAYVKANAYKDWCVDKGVRDTGPFVDGKYYGTHLAVRIFYSPNVMKWLVNGRKDVIPDGAMIIKEMFPAPAASNSITKLPEPSWTVMLKDSKGAKDGWYWAGLWSGMPDDAYGPPFGVFNAGFGLYCIRCHASAEKELTYSSLVNIKGYPGEPLTFFVDESWRTSAKVAMADPHDASGEHNKIQKLLPDPDEPESSAFSKAFGGSFKRPLGPALPIPGETYDHVVPGQKGPEQFITSDQCMGCHAGLQMGPVMVERNINFSPYGEWRWSPMGLAGRDPIFFSQLDSEIAFADSIKSEQDKKDIINTCFRCHGVMGKRQLDLDQRGAGDFKLDFVYNTNQNDPTFKYGALGRDGISCAVCHHIVPDKVPPGENPLKYFLNNSITGKFTVGEATEISGPFTKETISTFPMKTGLGIEPKFNEYTKNSQICGSCHTIDLPVMDAKPGTYSIEQATYLEWLNSELENEFDTKNPKAKSCQDCHMSGSYQNLQNTINIPQIQTRIAASEDETYPAAEHRAPLDQIMVRYRNTGYARHQFQGLNVFLAEMFRQNNTLLGVNLGDYMTGLFGLPVAIDNFVETAQNQTAKVTVSNPTIANQKLTADVTVVNKTGHRLPSGVGFRRAFIEFLVIDKSSGKDKTVWSSGQTNALGFIVDNNGQILPSEYIATNQSKGEYQHHYYAPDHPLTSSNQVEIYEELTKDATGKFTTSFIRRDEEFKDNRILPRGWTEKGPDPASLDHRFLEATYPKGEAWNDPHYRDGSGTSVVRYEIPLSALPAGVDPTKLTVTATLYSQTIPPYYLLARFQGAPNAPGTQRLFFIGDHLDVDRTPIDNWKLLLDSFTVSVGGNKTVGSNGPTLSNLRAKRSAS